MAELLGIILNGVGLGLALSILLGPVFFALIHTSISKGFREGFIMAIGIVVSDATYLTIAFFLANLVDQPFVKNTSVMPAHCCCWFMEFIFWFPNTTRTPPMIPLGNVKFGKALSSKGTC